MFSVAHNVLKNHYRSKRRNDDKIDYQSISAHDLGPSPSTIVAENRVHQALLDGLRRIPSESQVILELHYWEDLMAAEIGEVLGIPVGTAKTRLRRARQLLEDGLAATGATTPDPGELDENARALRHTVLAG